MTILKERDRRFLERKFERELKGDVRLILFTSEEGCEYCETARQIVEEVSQLSPKIRPEYYDVVNDREKAESWEIDKTPAILLFGEKEYKVRFFGLPSGYEFTTLVEDIVDVSKGRSRLSPALREKVASIKTPIHIQVFVTPTCPYCPRAVRAAHQMAIENMVIKSDMVEAMEFPELSQRYEVMAVPKVVINDSFSFEGALPEPHFVDYVVAVAEGRAEGQP